MTIQVILAPLTGGDADAAVLAAALATAKRFDAHVDATFLSPDPRDMIPYLGEGVSGSLVEEFITRAEEENAERTRRVRADFDAWRDAAALPLAEKKGDFAAPSCAWREVIGTIDRIVVSLGRLSDLIIAPRGSDDAPVIGETAFEAALLQSGRPLILPPPTPQNDFGDRVAVAWDGSAEATRAVGAALPFLRAAKSVTAITVPEDDKPDMALDDLARYLSWHDVSINTRTVEADGEGVGGALTDAAARENADLLVMGAYSHSRIREYILGGATRHVLDEATLPVFMAH